MYAYVHGHYSVDIQGNRDVGMWEAGNEGQEYGTSGWKSDSINDRPTGTAACRHRLAGAHRPRIRSCESVCLSVRLSGCVCEGKAGRCPSVNGEFGGQGQRGSVNELVNDSVIGGQMTVMSDAMQAPDGVGIAYVCCKAAAREKNSLQG
eukprot:GHVU01077344.1.p3 GENE.GHVU01077344.1~~GHVU01077344.1.p3  ORF type:complete len:149 (-),score=7.07 GHVU01077344.1:2562-3008(-)